MNREATAFVLSEWLEAEGREVEAALQRAVTRFGAVLPEPAARAMAHGVLSGGKRLRPVLCVAAYRAAGGGGPASAIHDLAVGLELIHAYSLMHDDLPCMDDAALRRGRPTTHRVHGAGVTTRAGAALIPIAALQVLEAARALGCTYFLAADIVRWQCSYVLFTCTSVIEFDLTCRSAVTGEALWNVHVFQRSRSLSDGEVARLALAEAFRWLREDHADAEPAPEAHAP